MIECNPSGDYPQIDRTACLHATAAIIGNVKIGKRVFIGPYAVIRADEPGSSVIVGANCNIQDRVVVHALGGSAVTIEDNVSLSHGCIVHGPCSIGGGCFIGFASVVFNASLRGGIFVGFSAVISGVAIAQGRFICDGAVINTAEKAKKLKVKKKACANFAQRVIDANLDLVKGYRREVEDGR